MQLEKILKLAIPITIVGAIVYEGIQWYKDIKYFPERYLEPLRKAGM